MQLLLEMKSQAVIAGRPSWEGVVLGQYEKYKKYATTQRENLIQKVENGKINLNEAWSTYLRKLIIKYPSGGHVTSLI
jgi:hypothetical protein